MCVAPDVVCVAMQQGCMLLQVRLQLPSYQLIALLLLKLHCEQDLRGHITIVVIIPWLP